MNSEQRRPGGRVATLLTATGAVVVAAVLDGAAVVGAVAAGISATPAILLGAIVAAGAASAGSLPHHRQRGGWAWSIALILVALLASLFFLMPTPTSARLASGLRLPDGTNMPVRVRERPGSEPPLIAVHGGPGIPFTEKEESALQEIVTDRTVVTFDQIGAGGASRLDRPSDYSYTRAVDDLEDLVLSIGSPQVVLLGFSDGAGVATAYAAAHPEKVASLIMLSPGPLPGTPESQNSYSPQSRLDLPSASPLYVTAVQPRNLFMYLLTLVDPDVAHDFGGDGEMDARYAELVRLASPGLHCSAAAPSGADDPQHPFPGFYLHQVLSERPPQGLLDSNAWQHLKTVPMLILRGSCDYVPRHVAVAIASQFPIARMVDLDGAGHALLEDQPRAVSAEITRFLEDAG